MATLTANPELGAAANDAGAAERAARRDVRRPDGADAAALLRRDDFDRDVWCLLGLPVDVSDIDHATAEVDAAARTGRRLSFVTPNVNWLARACRDRTARQEILNADLSLVDGAPLVALAKALGVPVRSRVAGSDLFEALRRRPAYAGRRLKVFFFGGRDGAAEAAAKAVNSENGGVEAVGWLNPGYGDVEAMSGGDVIAQINDAAPDFVVVALGAAKGQAWIDRNQSRLTAPVIAHLGAVVDFTAGGVARAPVFIRKLGLEWAWRIKEEPALWRRYFSDGLTLAAILWRRFRPQRRFGAAAGADGAADARVSRSADAVALALSGDLRHASLRPLRTAFRQAAAAGQDVILDFTGVRSFDRAFLGLVLMLEKNLAAYGAGIFITGASRRQLAVLRANDMRYPERAAAGGETVSSAQGAQGSAA